MTDATITWISGPVLRAVTRRSFQVNEAALVGRKRLPGEVIRIDGETVVIQVYEDTTGLRPGDPISATGAALSVRLGPGLLGNIFDGLLRPLIGLGRYVQPGISPPDDQRTYPFKPSISLGDLLKPGDVIGSVTRTDARSQRALAPPGHGGEVTRIAAAGDYPEDAVVCVLRDDQGESHDITLSQRWPVRRPRPVAARIPVEGPLFTGQRVLDSMFPLACGGRAAMPGGFGTGKTVLQETLAKWCDADVIVYVGCGERGNEMAGVLHEFPSLEDPRSGRPLMERTVIIANTSNMPVAAREASI
jgi:V/A-type H+-transporting ATPase subunit A